MRIIYHCLILLLCIISLANSKSAKVYDPKKIKVGGVKGSKNGCPCWFDLDGKIGAVKNSNKKGCACCPKGYLPCGYPNYKKCFKASQFKKGDRVGCQGTNPYPTNTLSTIGGPCPWDFKNKTCAICATDSFVCSDFATSPMPKKYDSHQYCRKYDDSWNYRCWGTNQDCRNNPGICHSKASCKNTGIKANKKDGWTRYQCQCKKGYIGTGFVCVKQSKIPKKKRKLIPNLKDMF